MEIPVNPRGPEICTCLAPDPVGGTPSSMAYNEHWYFICTHPINAEDGLCAGCRISKTCQIWAASDKELPMDSIQEIQQIIDLNYKEIFGGVFEEEIGDGQNT